MAKGCTVLGSGCHLRRHVKVSVGVEKNSRKHSDDYCLNLFGKKSSSSYSIKPCLEALHIKKVSSGFKKKPQKHLLGWWHICYASNFSCENLDIMHDYGHNPLSFDHCNELFLQPVFTSISAVIFFWGLDNHPVVKRYHSARLLENCDWLSMITSRWLNHTTVILW